jgi:ubiquinone/menaquinone biosynthesis C-methylase UbiE
VDFGRGLGLQTGMQLALPSSRLLDRVRHQVGHRALAAVLGIGTSVWHKALYPGFPRPPLEQIAALRRWFEALMDEDFANVEAGFYPRDMALELPVADLLRSLPEALGDLPRMVRRAHHDVHDLPVAVDDRYPDYYQRTFHWQVDGWLSAHSARIYDAQVQFLFFGTMDMMRRMMFPRLVAELRTAVAPRILDVACGTGRLVRHLQRVLPKAQVFGVDLSPHYIQRAQATCSDLPGVSLLVGNAEDLPLASATFEAVTCGFLFHELPGDARRRVLREIHRVLKPGGLFVFQDSPQVDDRNAEELRFYIDWFPRAYHEPYYKGYLKDPVEKLCQEAGFEVLASEPKLLSKLIVARK